MSKRNTTSYVNGTAALKMPRWVQSPDEATIIAFPGTRCSDNAGKAEVPKAAQKTTPAGKRTIASVLESSEMLCSLRSESLLGCPYNMFSHRSIAVLAAGSAAIGAISLILGLS